jgi:hypothetical protein
MLFCSTSAGLSFFPTLQELRRIQRRDGLGAHRISIADILGGKLNDLRFSDRVWESSFMSRSGFYTNRMRFGQLTEMFKAAGFTPEIRRVHALAELADAQKKMTAQFAGLPEEDRCISGLDLYLH